MLRNHTLGITAMTPTPFPETFSHWAPSVWFSAGRIKNSSTEKCFGKRHLPFAKMCYISLPQLWMEGFIFHEGQQVVTGLRNSCITQNCQLCQSGFVFLDWQQRHCTSIVLFRALTTVKATGFERFLIHLVWAGLRQSRRKVQTMSHPSFIIFQPAASY